MSDINVKDNIVFKGGDRVGTLDENSAFVADEGVNGNTAKAVARAVAQKAKPESDEPEKDPQMGDLTPDLVDWREANWTPEQFNELYPPQRLKLMGR